MLSYLSFLLGCSGETLDLSRRESSLLTDILLFPFLFSAKRLERLSFMPCTLTSECLYLEISLVSSCALILEMSSNLMDCSMLLVRLISILVSD